MLRLLGAACRELAKRIDSGIAANTIRRLMIINATPRLIRALTRARLSARKSDAQGSRAQQIQTETLPIGPLACRVRFIASESKGAIVANGSRNMEIPNLDHRCICRKAFFFIIIHSTHRHFPYDASRRDRSQSSPHSREARGEPARAAALQRSSALRSLRRYRDRRDPGCRAVRLLPGSAPG